MVKGDVADMTELGIRESFKSKLHVLVSAGRRTDDIPSSRRHRQMRAAEARGAVGARAPPPQATSFFRRTSYLTRPRASASGPPRAPSGGAAATRRFFGRRATARLERGLARAEGQARGAARAAA